MIVLDDSRPIRGHIETGQLQVASPTIQIIRDGQDPNAWTAISDLIFHTCDSLPKGLAENLLQAGARLMIVSADTTRSMIKLDRAQIKLNVDNLVTTFGPERVRVVEIGEEVTTAQWSRDRLGWFGQDQAGKLHHFGSCNDSPFYKGYVESGKGWPKFYRQLQDLQQIKVHETPIPIRGGDVFILDDKTVVMTKGSTKGQPYFDTTLESIDAEQEIRLMFKSWGVENLILIDPMTLRLPIEHVDLLITKVGDTIFVPGFHQEALESANLSACEKRYNKEIANKVCLAKRILEKEVSYKYRIEELLIPLCSSPDGVDPRFFSSVNLFQQLSHDGKLNVILPSLMRPSTGSDLQVDSKFLDHYDDVNITKLKTAGADNVLVQPMSTEGTGFARCYTCPIPEAAADLIFERYQRRTDRLLFQSPPVNH